PREQLDEGTLRRHADIRVLRRKNPWKGRLLLLGVLLLVGGAVAVVGLPPAQMQAVAEVWVKVKDMVVPVWERVAQLAVKGVGGK
ncbi:MAG: hypothetical protein FJ086_07315, partial [Deltaproteobacteria bacterium]|nr:hypothetical protein [Deltaproteobacteria bacterium]